MNTLQLDMLKEFMNISLGEANKNVAILLNAFGTMHIPKISIHDTSEIKNILLDSKEANENYYVMKQLFAGEFSGESIFIVHENSAKNLNKHLNPKSEDNLDELNDIVMELTNMVSASVISRLTKELNVEVQFFAPQANLLKGSNLLDMNEIVNYSKVIVMQTYLEFKELGISADIFILTKEEAMQNLIDLIDLKIVELYA